MYYNMFKSNVLKLNPGRNLLDIKKCDLGYDISNKNIKLTLQLSNCKNVKESIYIVNTNVNKVYKTDVKNTTWYNEVGTGIIVNCVINSVEDDISILCYSSSYQLIDLSAIVSEQTEEKVEFVSTIEDLELEINKRFKTNRDVIKDLITLEVTDKLKFDKSNDDDSFPLSEKTYDHNEINAMFDVLLSEKLTMGSNVETFEKEFAKFIGSNYAIMVNSGSSANLLAMAVLSNFKFDNCFKKGDKVIVPTICWSTSVWPIIQMGLEPVFVDINIDTLNADIEKVEELIENDPKIRGMVVVHILGNTTNMDKLMELKNKFNLILMEDTCESLGSKYNDKFLGTFGECGTYSFYFSHHITTIEGGMVVTDDFKTYELLKCLRAHGWSRGITGYNNDSLDNRFCFINIGYNLRPMEIQAAMGLVQLKRLTELNNNRIKNYERVIDLISNSNSDILTFFKKEPNSKPAWFALPFILNKKHNKEKYLNYLESNNIATRPVVTGNFARQPVFKDLNIDIDPSTFINAEIVHDHGFFIGLPSYLMSDEKVKKLVNILLSY